MQNLGDFSETKVQLTLGEHQYLVNFGIYARRRIEERHPNFNLLDHQLPDFEVVPFLIQCGIEPEDHKWKDEREFFELYEECRDEEALAKIPLAFMNALGFINRQFIPVLERVSQTIPQAQAKTPNKSNRKR
ncbi:hypothetical protein [Dyadobacter fermentans]|uniref:hypothetical protein n=1 Tax=Dyadobacter fermentans TaxID=94254 RepID=UPI001CBD0A9B|nr:hypothetical protein [Dyadobacter fermentans]MBZ1362137.1 hypothetical protein [Dyadobacter fermentans]